MDNQKITRERQKLMITMLEKKIRLRAQQLYDQRGQEEGKALEDWSKAESEVLKSSILAPLWNIRENVLSSDVSFGDSQSHEMQTVEMQQSV